MNIDQPNRTTSEYTSRPAVEKTRKDWQVYTSKVESEFPHTTAGLKQLKDEGYDLFCRKMHDYGPNNITLGSDLQKPEEKHIALMALIVRLNDKIQRLNNLVLKKKETVANEPIEDAFADIAGYANIAQLVLRDKWGD